MDRRSKMDPSLKHMSGDEGNDPALAEVTPERDLVGDLIHASDSVSARLPGHLWVPSGLVHIYFWEP